MIAPRKLTLKHFLCAAMAISMIGIATSDAAAQIRGGRPRRPSQNKNTPPPPPRDNKPAVESPGRTEGTIINYKPADEDDIKEDEKLLGKIKIRPFGDDVKILVLKVRDTEEFSIKLADHEFDKDDIKFYFQKGLHVEANWGYVDPDAKRKVKVLHTLRFMTTEITAEVEEIVEQGVEVKGVPINNQHWPEWVPPKDMNNKEEKIYPRRLKLRFIEDVSTFRNKDNEETDVGEFRAGDKVRVTAVYAHGKIGMLVNMRPPNVSDTPPTRDEPAPDEPKPPGQRPRPPGQPAPGG